MKTIKKILKFVFIAIVIVIAASALTCGKKPAPEKAKESVKKEAFIEETTAEEQEATEEVKEDTKYSELNFIKVKRLKKEFGDRVTKATISIVEKDGPEYVAQMNAIDDILTELKLAKKVENLGGLEELYDLFIEDIETTVDMLIAESLESEEYDELHKKVMELDEKFLNEYHRIENRLKE